MTTLNAQRWQDVLAEIRKSLRKQQYDTWFKRVHFASADGTELQLIVPNHFYADWLGSNYRTTVEEAVQKVLGFNPTVRFQVDSAAYESIEPPVPETGAKAAPPPQLNRDYDLDNFVVGNNNRLAQAAARSVAESPGTVYNPLFVHSRAGMGKTHLLQAICHRFLELHPAQQVAYLGAREFTAALVRARREKTTEAFRATYCSVSLLALDDVHLLADKESSQEEFFHVFNELHSQKQQLVVSAHRPPQDIPTLSERLASRLRWGLTVGLDEPDHETRLAVLRQKAAARHLRVADEVLAYVASHVEGSIRELEGALIRLAALASLTQRPMTVAAAREALQSYGRKAPRAIGIPQIQEAVARHFGLETADLVSRNRSRSVAFPRQVGMFLARGLTNLSLADIGRHFGGRDHTTVLHACEKIEGQKELDDSLAEALGKITRLLQSGPGSQA